MIDLRDITEIHEIKEGESVGGKSRKPVFPLDVLMIPPDRYYQVVHLDSDKDGWTFKAARIPCPF
jgi:hypothetical protein